MTDSILKFEGIDGSTVVEDELYEANSVEWSLVGGAELSDEQAKFGSTSLKLNGSNYALSPAGNSYWNFAKDKFTIEFWVYLTDTPNGGALFSEVYTGSGFVSITIAFKTSGAIGTTGDLPCFGYFNGSWSNLITANDPLPLNEWVHIAATKDGSNYYLFANGVMIASGVMGTPPTQTDGIYLGRRWDTSGVVDGVVGYIDSFRYSPNKARYTENFTPPTMDFSGGSEYPYSNISKFDSVVLNANPVSYWKLGTDTTILMEDLLDINPGSHTNVKYELGGGVLGDNSKSIKYTGASSYSVVAYDPTLATSDFSFELWAKFGQGALTSYQYILSQQQNNGSLIDRFAFTTGNSATDIYGKLRMWLRSGTVWTGFDSPTQLFEDKWYHIAFSYDSSASLGKIYIDGKLDTIINHGSLNTPTCQLSVAHLNANGSLQYFLDGQLQNIAWYDRPLNELEVYQRFLVGRRIGSNYPYQVIKSDPLAYWRLSEHVGSSRYHNEVTGDHLTIKNNPIEENDGLTVGYSKSIYFPADSYSEIESIPLDFTTNSLSVELWAEIKSLTGTTAYILSREDSGDNSYVQCSLEVEVSTGKLIARIENFAGTDKINLTTDSFTVSVDTPYHIILTWNKDNLDSTDFNLYVNGSAVAFTMNVTSGTYDAGFSLANQSGLLQLSRRESDSTEVSDIILDQVSIYNRELSSSEVSEHYLYGTALQSSQTHLELCQADGAIHYWILSNTSIDDQISTNNGSVGKGTITAGVEPLGGGIEKGVEFNSARYDVSSLNLTTNWTIEFVIKQDSDTDYETILSDGSIGIILYNNKLGWFNSTQTEATTNINRKAVHCALTWDGTTGIFYVNGKPDGTFSAVPATWEPGFLFGDSTTQDFTGFAQSVVVYDSTLTQEQIRHHYLAVVTDGKFITYGISGITQQNGVNAATTLRAYRRDNGELSAETISNASTGNYKFVNLEGLTEYDIVCIGDSSVCPQISGPIQAEEEESV